MDQHKNPATDISVAARGDETLTKTNFGQEKICFLKVPDYNLSSGVRSAQELEAGTEEAEG